MAKTLTGKIESFQERQVIIKLIDGGEILWPIKNLPEDLVVGDEVSLSLSAKVGLGFDNDEAQNVLNEILHVEDKKEDNGY